MSDEKYIDIHGHKVQLADPDSHTLKSAVEHLSNTLAPDEAKVFFDEARHDLVNHKAHLEVRDHTYHTDRNVTLIHHSDGTFILQKRHHDLLRS